MAKENKAVLLAGAPRCGKTTLALSLIRDGLKSLSDDDTILRMNGNKAECLSLPQNPPCYISLS